MATRRILHNNRLLWVDANANGNDADTQQTLRQLITIVHHVDRFTQIDGCLQFFNEVNNEQALVITSGSLGQQLVHQIHQLPHVYAIYIFCSDVDRHRSWANQWSKIQGVYNSIQPICEALRTAVKQINEDLTPISIVSKSEKGGDLNRLEPSFMYTTLFKRILLDMKHEPDARRAIVELCRTHLTDDLEELQIVEEFNRKYRREDAIWWFTRECFTYNLLNRALRLLESDIIVDMGFFIHDLHRQLKQLHRKQLDDYRSAPLTLYRGQAMSNEDLAKLQKSLGGLFAFNSFLSASKERSISPEKVRGVTGWSVSCL